LDRLQAIEAFLAVAERGSFSAAARALGTTKSTVSKRVRLLEERLGVRLLHRTTRKLALTGLGEVYRENCRRLLAELADTEAMLLAHARNPRGRLRASAPMTFGVLYLGGFVARFLERYPEVALDLTLDDRYVDLVGDGYDVAIRIGRLEDSSLMARRLGTAASCCVASPVYLERHGLPADPRDLAAHNCLRYLYRRRPDEWRFEREGEAVTVRIQGTLSANNGDMLREAACAGLGVARLPAFMVVRELEAGRLRVLLPDWSGEEVGIFAVYPPHRQTSPVLRAFIDALVAHFRDTGGNGWRTEPGR